MEEEQAVVVVTSCKIVTVLLLAVLPLCNWTSTAFEAGVGALYFGLGNGEIQ